MVKRTTWLQVHLDYKYFVTFLIDGQKDHIFYKFETLITFALMFHVEVF